MKLAPAENWEKIQIAKIRYYLKICCMWFSTGLIFKNFFKMVHVIKVNEGFWAYLSFFQQWLHGLIVTDLREIFLPWLQVIYLYNSEVAYNQSCVLSIQIKSQKLISTHINQVHILNGVRTLTNTLLSNNSKIRVSVTSRHLY